MKKMAIVMFLFLMGGHSFAQNSPQDYESILRCAEIDGLGILEIQKNTDVHGDGLITYGSLDNVHNPSESASIAYTSAGARAIVTSESHPQLIFAGMGEVEIKWNEKEWACFSFL